MTRKFSLVQRNHHLWALTASFKIRETALSACFSADVQEDGAAGLVEGVVEYVTLFESVGRMWFIARGVGEVVDLACRQYVVLQRSEGRGRRYRLLDRMHRIRVLARLPLLNYISASQAMRCRQRGRRSGTQ